jgi:hypothetical protein
LYGHYIFSGESNQANNSGSLGFAVEVHHADSHGCMAGEWYVGRGAFELSIAKGRQDFQVD